MVCVVLIRFVEINFGSNFVGFVDVPIGVMYFEHAVGIEEHIC